MSDLQEPTLHPRAGLIYQKLNEFTHFDNVRYDNIKLQLSAQINICRNGVIVEMPQHDIKSISFNYTKKELSILVFDGYSLVFSKEIIKKIIITTELNFDTCRRKCYPFDITAYLQNSRSTIAETNEFKSLCFIVKFNNEIEHGGVIEESEELNSNIIIAQDENLAADEKWLMINNIRKIISTEALPYITIEFIDYGLTCGQASQTKTIRVNKDSCTENGFLYTYKK
jgi:hypothetical protein